MLETEIKKHREELEKNNGLLVELIQALSNRPSNATQQPEAKTEPKKAKAPAAEVETPQAEAPQTQTPEPEVSPTTTNLTEWGVYATNLAAMYSAKTGNPAAVMAVSQKHGIMDIASATDVQLVPLCDELKALMGVQ